MHIRPLGGVAQRFNVKQTQKVYFFSPQVLPLLNPGYFIISILAALVQLASAAALLLISYTDKMKANYA